MYTLNVLTKDGKVLTFGTNYGATGNGVTGINTQQRTPFQVTIPEQIIEIQAGGLFEAFDEEIKRYEPPYQEYKVSLLQCGDNLASLVETPSLVDTISKIVSSSIYLLNTNVLFLCLKLIIFDLFYSIHFQQMHTLFVLAIVTLYHVYARTINNSLDGYVSDYCVASRELYYLRGNAMQDIALQYDLQNFSAPVSKATLNLVPYLCFNSQKMNLYLKTSDDEISFSHPCKKYDYSLRSYLNFEDSTCRVSIDVTSAFNKAVEENKKFQLFIVDTWVQICDRPLPGTQSTPSCQVKFQGASDAPIYAPSFQIEVEESNQQTTVGPVVPTSKPTTATASPTTTAASTTTHASELSTVPATSSVTTDTTKAASVSTRQATPAATSQNNQAGQNNSSQQERSSATKELLSSSLIIAALVFA